MITGVHTMFYSSKAGELRAFIRDKLQFAATDVGDGWLIFDLPDAELGCHPADESQAPSGTHHVSFYCDNIHRTVAELRRRGVEFTGEIEDHGYGLVTKFRVPGDFSVQLFQPRYTRNAGKRRKPKPAKPRHTAKRGAVATKTMKGR